MGTFGTGPFSSDGALDLVEELVELDAAGRLGELGRIFSTVLKGPQTGTQTVFPHEVVAAAALIAISLPGGESILADLSEFVADELAPALLPTPAVGLVAPALAALTVVAGPGGPWHDGWIDDRSRAEAAQTVERLTAVLRESGLRARPATG
ncbi:DUF4259 domain-containing protein [Polymorphospora sp. NPDC051019]|uniref:DUF4259 domain-containing protein n=1 Tax=Polymorphospora sp. NPDC051019 TaxID=3155725 RepID=UPI003413802A